MTNVPVRLGTGAQLVSQPPVPGGLEPRPMMHLGWALQVQESSSIFIIRKMIDPPLNVR